MPHLTVRLPDLHSTQQTVCDSRARFRVCTAGRRWGKSLLGAVECVATALPGGAVLWVSPSYPMATGRWEELKDLAGQIPNVQVKEADHTITFSTGGSIRVRSGKEPQSLRGDSYDLVVLDEAAFFPDLETLWLQVLRPALSDRQGRALFISTPGGMNYFWQLWNTGNDPLQAEWQSWQLPTSTNPYIKPTEIEAARKGMTQRAFEQEYLAQFNPDGGAVFRFLDKVCILHPQTKPIEGHRFFFGVDWGRTYDSTAISVFDSTARHQVYLDRFTGTAWELQRKRLKALNERWQPEVILAEANSIGEPNIEALERDGLPMERFTTTAQSKPELIEGLSLAVERGATGDKEGVLLLSDQDPEGKVQLAELQAYQMDRTASGRYVYGAPSGTHDDTVIAAALSVYAANHHGRTISVGPAPAFLTNYRGDGWDLERFRTSDDVMTQEQREAYLKHWENRG